MTVLERSWLLWVMCIGLLLAPAAQAQTIHLLGGTGTAGFSGNGTLDEFAQFDTPLGISGDTTGALYIADTGNHLIRNIHDRRDTIVTVAGTAGTAGFSGDAGAATSATLNAPWDVFVAGSGTLYVADTGNHRIRRITPAGIISTVAGTGVAGFSGDGAAATSAQLKSPTGVFVSGGVIYIADQGNHRIRAITGSTITTFAGTGTDSSGGDGGAATAADLSSPTDVFADTSGVLYVTDTGNHKIRAIATDSTISTIAGTGASGFSGDGGLALDAQLAFPRSVFVDTAGNVYITDRFNHRLRRINTNGVITTLAGDGTPAYAGNNSAANLSQLASPSGIWLYGEEIYFTDAGTHRIRWIDDDNMEGLSGATTSAPGRQVTLLRASFTGDGVTGVKGVSVTISDLSTATGLERSDFSEFHLYESVDALLSSDDVLLGTRDVDDVTIGSPFDIQATPTSVPGVDVERHYLVVTRFSTTATEGHALRIGVESGGLSTSIGGHGHRIVAADANSISLDVVATQMLFSTQPQGVISGNPFVTQPLVTAVDDSGYVDGDFTDTVTLTLSAGSTGTLLQTTATAVAGIATFTGVTYFAGADQETIELIADDVAGGAEGDLPTVTSNTISANSANDTPTVSPFSFTINEDDSVRVPISSMVHDVDDSLETLQITFVANHTSATLDGLDLTIRPDADYFGPDTLIIIATDPFGASASGSSILTIKSVNDAVEITPLPIVTIDEDDTLVVELAQLVTDKETPFADLTWAFFPAPGLLTDFDMVTGRLLVWASTDSAGDFPLQLSVTDENLSITSHRDTISVLPVNDPPRLLVADTTLARGDTLVLTLSELINDADDELSTLSTTIVETHGLLATLMNLTLTAQASSGFSGTGWILFEASDPHSAVMVDTLRVSVFTANPQAPVITALPAIAVEIGDTVTVDLAQYISDPDHDTETLTLSLSPLPQGVALVEQHSITLIASANVASFEITVTVEDPDGEKSATALQIDFIAPTPLLSGLPSTLEIAVSGRQELLDPFVTGGDPSEVTWSAQTVGDVDVFIDDINRTLRVTPRNASRAGGQVVLFASSPRKAAVETLAVTIVNAPPLVTLPDPFFVTIGAPGQLLLDNLVTDDEEVGFLTWTGLPLTSGLEVSINAAVRAVTLTASPEATTNVRVVLTATDEQGASGADTFLVTILGIDTGEDSTLVDTSNGNRAPVVGPLAAVEVFSGGTITRPIAALASDDDDLVELTWSLDAGTGIDASISNGTLTIQTLEGFSGQTSLGLTATDTFGAQDSTLLTINVSALVANPAPGDFGRDGQLDFEDFFLFINHLGLATFHRGWDPLFDLVEDGRIDLDDFFAFVELFHAARAAR
ncbi:MAG: hypothetical protein HOM68_26540 [Gemmatimonadetes bacterium]|nr:hypothetical protein [Gemmatimonadota bacterium]MBT5965604.1 hypothetical protein [Gemmatimonadota bacterium]MBT7455787.1 hypothetical protein [Gemmatimonadota bacterium]